MREKEAAAPETSGTLTKRRASWSVSKVCRNCMAYRGVQKLAYRGVRKLAYRVLDLLFILRPWGTFCLASVSFRDSYSAQIRWGWYPKGCSCRESAQWPQWSKCNHATYTEGIGKLGDWETGWGNWNPPGIPLESRPFVFHFTRD